MCPSKHAGHTKYSSKMLAVTTRSRGDLVMGSLFERFQAQLCTHAIGLLNAHGVTVFLVLLAAVPATPIIISVPLSVIPLSVPAYHSSGVGPNSWHSLCCSVKWATQCDRGLQ